MIKVLIAEDQAMMRGALAVLLDLEPDLQIVGQVGSGEQILPAVEEFAPDIALVDIELPALSGIDATRLIGERRAGCKVVIVTTFGRPGYLRRAMEAGARGFLVKDGPVDALAQTIRRVHAGETVVDPGLATAALSAGANPLTEREQDVLVAASEGATVAVISRTLHLSDSTVRNYLSSAIGKTGSRNRMEAVHIARSNGWL